MTATEGYVYARKTDHYQHGKVIHIGVNDKEENWELIIEEEPLNEEML